MRDNFALVGEARILARETPEEGWLPTTWVEGDIAIGGIGFIVILMVMVLVVIWVVNLVLLSSSALIF